MKQAQLLTLLQQGESDKVEFKRELNQATKQAFFRHGDFVGQIFIHQKMTVIIYNEITD